MAAAASRTIVLVNPNVALQENDVLNTGIVYMPVALAEFAGTLVRAGRECRVIDAFGDDPRRWWKCDRFLMLGLTPDDVTRRLPDSMGCVVIYAINIASHLSVLALSRAIRKQCPSTPIVIMENTQAVTGYSLRAVRKDFYDAGASALLTGEPELRGPELIDALLAGAATTDDVPARTLENLDEAALPAWELFPLENYWRLGYAHAPLTTKRYLPLLTSRGCPYPCAFCVIPETNGRRWRAKSPERVVSEIRTLMERFHVDEFHVEDVDPTVDEKRIRAIGELLVKQKIKIRWKLGSGTKIETIREESTLDILARAGCTYISVSPESGSSRVLKMMNKPFNREHAVRMIRGMARVGIRSQACFVLGFPGEEDEDRAQTNGLIAELARAGVDEIAVFIATPMPGAAVFDQLTGYQNYSELTFSPSWRRDFAALARWRARFYRTFLWNRARRHAGRFFAQALRGLSGRFETKMEMTPRRWLRGALLRLRLRGTNVSYDPN